MAAVSTSVFPHRALEIQRLWMNRAMRKPYELTTRKTAAAITRLNNSLPLFPGGSAVSKFSDVELVGLLEWSLPPAWRSQFDLKGYVPTLETKARLISECEAIERNKTENKTKKGDESSNNKNKKKSKAAKTEGEKTKSGAAAKGNAFFCKECGRNGTHATEDCYILKNRAKRAQTAANKASDNKTSTATFSKRTFHKEVNALAHKAGKKKVLGLYEAALKREQAKQAKHNKKHAKTRVEDTDSSDSEESNHLLEQVIIPRKDTEKTPTSILKRRALKVQFTKALEKHRKDKALKKVAEVATLEEEAAFLKQITQSEEVEMKTSESSGSD
jgi:hypothetical protein